MTDLFERTLIETAFEDAGEAAITLASADTFILTGLDPAPAGAERFGDTARLISGTRFADDIRGTRRDDEIFARGGDDLVRARDGDDLVDGGKGDDLLYGGDGRDDIFGERGKDTIYGGRGRDNFWFDEANSFDKIRDFRAGDTLVVDGIEGDFAGARRRDIEIDPGRNFDKLYVFDDLVARVYGDVVIADDILLLT